VTKIIAMLAKRLAVLSGPVLAWAAVAIIAGYLALIATVGVLNWRLNLAQDRQSSAEILLNICKTQNQNNVNKIAHIEAINQENIRAAREQAENAQQAALLADTQRERLERELTNDIKGLQNALDGNDCATDTVPVDLDRLYRNTDHRGEDG